MSKLVSMELKRNSLKPYKLATAIIFMIMLGFTYLIASIPLIEGESPDTQIFETYHFIVSLSCIVCMGIFSVMAGVIGAKFVVEEYSGKKAVLIFSYPVEREKILGAKVTLVISFVFVSMLLCEGAVLGIFVLTEAIFPLCREVITLQIILYAFFSLTICSGLAGLIGVISVWFGFLRKSIVATIVSSIIIVSVLCQLVAQMIMLPKFSIPALIGVALFGIVFTIFVYGNLKHRIHVMEV